MAKIFKPAYYLSIALISMVLILLSTGLRIHFWRQLEVNVLKSGHHAAVTRTLAKLFSALQDLEIGERGFVITDSEEFLEPYQQAHRVVQEMFAELRAQISSEPGQLKLFNQYQALAEQKLSFIHASIEARRGATLEKAVSEEKLLEGKKIMDQMRVVNAGMSLFQQKAFNELSAEIQKSNHLFERWTLIASVVGIIGSLLALYLYFVARQQARVEKDLENRAFLAEEAAKQKSLFLANMSHEFRTPMNAVLGFTEILQKTAVNEKEQRYLRAIKEAGTSLLQLINDTLDLSRVEAGLVELHLEPAQLSKLFEFTQIVVGQQAAEKQLEIKLEVPECPMLLLDEMRLRQVLVNLGANAVRYTERGHIKLSASLHATDLPGTRQLVINVTDTGIGIAPHNLDKIFNPYFQSRAQKHRSGQGSGLGLSIVKYLVTLMGGTIHVKSTMGVGSHFQVIFPHVRLADGVEADPASLGSTASDFNDFHPSSILVVDDNPVNRQLMSCLFEDSHHRLSFAENGKEALQQMTEQQPELVLMDLRMPVLGGEKAVEEMRKTRALHQVPVIAVTSNLEENDKLRSKFDGYIRKPFSRAELYEEISHHIPSCPGQAAAGAGESSGKSAPVTQEDFEAWQKMVLKLRRLEVSRWSSLQSGLAINEAIDFAAQLCLLAKEADCPMLHDYGETVRRSAEAFDADGLEKHIQDFPKLIQRLAAASIQKI